MRRLLSIIGVVACGLGANPASAKPLEYDCDTRAGSFSELKTVLSGSNNIVRGVVAAKRLYKHQRWQPTAVISFLSADNKEQIRIRLIAAPPAKDNMTEGNVLVRLEQVYDGKIESTDLGGLPIGEGVRFSITASDHGSIIQVADTKKEVQFKRGINPIAMASCSTGEFLFTEFEFPVD